MYTIKFTRRMDVPTHIAWHIISDLEKYADYAPNLRFAHVVSGDAVGLIRRCGDNRGGEWNETCVLWEDGRRYSVQVDTRDYPYPFTTMQGTWGVEPDGNRSLVTMQFEFMPKPNLPILSWFMVNLMMKPAFKSIGEQLMDNWEQAMLEAHLQKVVAIA